MRGNNSFRSEPQLGSSLALLALCTAITCAWHPALAQSISAESLAPPPGVAAGAAKVPGLSTPALSPPSITPPTMTAPTISMPNASIPNTSTPMPLHTTTQRPSMPNMPSMPSAPAMPPQTAPTIDTMQHDAPMPGAGGTANSLLGHSAPGKPEISADRTANAPPPGAPRPIMQPQSPHAAKSMQTPAPRRAATMAVRPKPKLKPKLKPKTEQKPKHTGSSTNN